MEPSEKELQQAKKIALRLLARRNYHSHLLLKKLVEKGVSEAVAAEAVNYFAHYLDDASLLARTVELELQRGHGPKAIYWKLRAKGLPEAEIQEALQQVATREAEAVVVKKLVAKWKGQPRQKIIQALFRRGFSLDRLQESIPPRYTVND